MLSARAKTIVISCVLGALVCAGGGVWLGWRLFGQRPTASAPTPQVILTALHDRGFLVTQTYVFDEPVTIENKSGNVFKDFFFGQTIVARGTMEVNLGIDLGAVTAADVTVQDGGVTVRVPKASLFNSRLVGPIELKNDQGVLKRLLDSDDGYNQALAELSRVAEAAATQPGLMDRADQNAHDDVTRLLTTVVPGAAVTVTTAP